MNIFTLGQTSLTKVSCFMCVIKTYFIVFIVALLLPQHAFSASSLEIVAKQRVIIAQSRGIVTLPFSVVNRSNKKLQLSEMINLPEGWRLLAKAGFFTLAKGESTLRLVHVLAPSDVPAGKYQIPYQIISKKNPSIRAEQNIAIVIKSSSKLSTAIIEKPEIVLAGEQYIIKLSVRNNGNVPLSLVARLKNTSPYPTTYEPKRLVLKPSEDSVITITAKIPSSLKESTFHTIKLSLNGGSIFLDKTIKTKIVTSTPKGTGQYHTIASKITTAYTNNQNGTDALQTEYRATGLLDVKGEHHLDLLYRDMKTNNFSSLGSDSENHLAYDSSELSVRIGDYSFPLAGITGDGFYGEGADINYHPFGRKWNVRALKARQREDDVDNNNNTDINGFELGYQFSKDLNVILNTLTLENRENNQKKEIIKGIDLRWEKFEAAEFRLSIGKDDDGAAYRLRQEGILGRINYDYEIQKADPEFDGLIKDIKSQSLSASYAFNENKNYLRTNLYHAKSNLNKDSSRRISEEKTVRFGVGHYFNNPLRDSLYGELYLRNREDLRTVSDIDQEETGLRFQYQKNINLNLRINTILEHVKTDNKLTGRLSKDLRGSLALAYKPNEKYRFGVHVDSTNISDNFDLDNKNSLRFGINATVQLSPRQRLSGYWNREDNNRNDNLQLNYDYTFNSGATFGASISNDTFNNDNKELSYQLKISIPFDTPLYRYNNISSLKGKVVNKALQQPVSNAIVEVAGQYAVTDKKGNYHFKAIREGKYDITTNLSKTSLNNYIVENDQQQSVTLTANQSSTHDIKLFQGTGIKGQVKEYRVSTSSLLFKNKSDVLVASGGIRNLLVTLTSLEDNEKIHKVLTSEGGYFNFNGVTSGSWSIQVTDPSKVIEESRITEPQQVVQLKRGEEKTVLFKSVPLSRQIKKVGPSLGFSVSGN